MKISGFLRLLWVIPVLLTISLCLHPGVAAADGGYEKNGNAYQSPGVSGQGQIHISQEHAPDRLIVRYNTGSIRSQLAMGSVQALANSEAGTKVVKDHGKDGVSGMQVVSVSDSSLEEAMKSYQENPDVLYVEPDYLISLSPVDSSGTGGEIMTTQAASGTYPDDPSYPTLWGLQNTGQSPFFGTPGADIRAQDAWGVTTGSAGVTVAVIDTGVDYTHPDLAANIWRNPKETVNGIDDDGNGYIDDVRGWNFVARSNDPLDDNGHGTHCAGTLAAVGNNGIGVSGVTWRSKIMPLKFLDAKGTGYTSDAIAAILYADRMGARIISNSWGGISSQALRDAIESSSALVICAAGNTGAHADSSPVYPAAYPSGNIISVAATDPRDQLASFSNYGSSTVDLAAPGVQIYSTAPGGRYSFMNGTSMATPYVSGVAALIASQSPSLTADQIKSRILNGCDRVGALSGKVATGGRLNAAKALGVTTPVPTPVITSTPTRTPTPYPTPVITSTPTRTPTPYPTPVITSTPTRTPTPYPTPVITSTPTRTPTPYPTPVITSTPTRTPTPYPTPVITSTPTRTPTPYPTPVVTSTPTRTPTPVITPSPTWQPGSLCGVYKTDRKSGVLRQGQAMVYGYYIPVDGRSGIDWSLTTRAPAGPKNGMVEDQSGKNRGQAGGSLETPVFDLYVFKDCSPRYSPCAARYVAFSPQSFVAVTPPQAGATYYVMIYARSGSGTYTLTATSYTCPPGGNGALMSAFASLPGTADQTAQDNIPVPRAEFVRP